MSLQKNAGTYVSSKCLLCVELCCQSVIFLAIDRTAPHFTASVVLDMHKMRKQMNECFPRFLQASGYKILRM